MRLDLNPLETGLVRSVMRNQELLREKSLVALQAAEEAKKRALGYQQESDALRASTLSAISLSRGVTIPGIAGVTVSDDGKQASIEWADPLVAEVEAPILAMNGAAR